MKNTTITVTTTSQLFIDPELGEILIQLRDIRKRFDAYLDIHNDPRMDTPCNEAFEVDGYLNDVMIGITRIIAARMADHLFDEHAQPSTPAC